MPTLPQRKLTRPPAPNDVCIIGGSPGDVSEEPVMQEKQKKGWRMSFDVGEATEGFQNEL